MRRRCCPESRNSWLDVNNIGRVVTQDRGARGAATRRGVKWKQEKGEESRRGGGERRKRGQNKGEGGRREERTGVGSRMSKDQERVENNKGRDANWC